ncbi:stage III sporulation protein AF [Anaerosalibacter bizertensis]|uniref:Stage III sporulation protein AF n=2 Tax=Anaerosalibacter bizertensis TaxID=932217 RepID=A0A844FFX1_9FIRM|nr:stage III sporulation protein AF [Anaerosalibacter bizertensis]MCG4564230.1 stage III sporulation protein AF [Anaerosalibacter bizertensis]MCG4584379.1 stage III sporulation protein AF [Anaerosalibacter bizertensis]MSS42871.1 stage III sporulation protein AF [Anaerosalibacter bizertensis]HHV26223.1 stage III sporulation protein AF [Tissierellia bacterium]
MVIFISFLEIVLPNSNMKRFIDMIVGFLIIVVIITPFIKIISKDIDIEKNFLLNSNKLNTEIKNNYSEEKEEVLALQEKQIIESYKKGIERKIGNLIKEKTNYEVKNIDMEINKDLEDKNYGEIKELNIVLREKIDKNSENEKSIKIENIEEVWIKKNKENKSNEKFEESDKIKKIISKEYGLSEEKISASLSRER